MSELPTIHFSHAAYALSERFALRDSGHKHFQTWSTEALRDRVGEAEVLVLSGFWDNALIPLADNLRYIHVSAVGYDQFDRAALAAANIRLSNSIGVNANAVSEQAIGLVLSFQRYLHLARDNQRARYWRPMISDFAVREDELPGKTLLIFGLGTIGQRISRLAQAFGVTTLGIKRDLSAGGGAVDELHPPEAFSKLLPRADFVVLACPLTDATHHLMNDETFAAMKPDAYLINVARGGCVDQDALLRALANKRIAGAGIDVTTPEPLDPDSPLWALDNVILTPHTGGETRKYEDNVVDILLDNLSRLERGEPLRNAIV